MTTYLRNTDIYGHPINLTFKEQSTFKSVFGGFITILTLGGILSYLIIQMLDVINHVSTITSTLQMINASLDEREYDIDKSQFDFAVKIDYLKHYLNPSINANIEQYAQIVLQQFSIDWATDSTGAYSPVWTFETEELELCPKGRFNNEKETTDLIGINNGLYYCQKRGKFNLKGSWSSISSKNFVINVVRCNQTVLNKTHPGKQCKNQTEIDNVFKNLQVYLPIMTQYFDNNELKGNPIKNSINFLYYQTHPTVSQTINYKLSRNFAILQDSPFSNYFQEKNITFYQYRLEQSFVTQQDLSGSNNPLRVVFVLDEQIKTIKRTTYTILDALSNVGGLFSIVVIVIKTLISKIQENMFHNSIIRKLYIHQRDTINNMASTNQIIAKDNTQQGSDLKFEDLLTSICNRVPFTYRIKDYLRYIITRFLFCCSKSKQQSTLKYQIFKNGVSKLKHDFEIINVLKTLQVSRQLTKLQLLKYQRVLLPYLKSNLISANKSQTHLDFEMRNKKKLNKSSCETLEKYLEIAYLKQKQSEIDKRLLKNLMVNKSKIDTLVVDKQKQQEINNILVQNIDEDIEYQNTVRGEKNDFNSSLNPLKLYKMSNNVTLSDL